MTQRSETGATPTRKRNLGAGTPPHSLKMNTKGGVAKKEKDQGGEKKGNFARKRKSDGGEDISAPGKNKQKAYSNSVDADGKPDWKKMRLEAKRLKESRKKKDMNPEIYELSKEAKVIWEELRKDSCPENVRTKLCEELHNLVKGHVKRLSYAHDTARVLESLLLHGSEPIRKNIHDAFSVKDDLLVLVKSKYGHFLAQKLIKYASKEQRDAIFKAMEPHVVQLLKHQFASRVLNDFYSTYAKAVQKTVIIKECYAPLLRLEESVGQDLKEILGKFPEKKATIMKNLQELIAFMLEKDLKTNSILHLLMHEYLENCEHSERNELITTMREELVNILHTPEGSLLGMSCLWHGTPKDRKVIVKTFKTFVPKIACDKNGHRVLLAAVDTVDDVVLISKAICSEMLNNINELVLNSFGQRTVVYFLEHRSTFFFDPETVKLLAQGDINEYTKKPIEQRLLDVTEPLLQEFVDGIIDNFGMWIKDNSACLVAKFILKRFSAESLDTAVEKIADCVTEVSTIDGIEKRAVDMLVKFILFDLPMKTRVSFSLRLIKKLKELSIISPWLQTNRGCFTLLRIWEKCGEDSEPGKEIKKLLKANSVTIKKLNSAGGKLLKDIL